MSLINKMLQDLDARGGGAASAVQQSDVKSVPALERDRRPLLIGAAAAGVLVVAAAGWYGWQRYRTPAGPVPTVQDNRIPNKPRFQEPPAAIKAGVPAAAIASATLAPDHSAAPSALTAAAHDRVAAHEGEPAPSRAVAKPASIAHAERGEGADADMPAMVTARKATRASAAANGTPADGVVVRDLTPKQMSENSYRRALVALQEGRVSAALADLDKAVEVDPRNDAARQTYVSLLLENRRTDDAIRQLRLALGVEPRQPGLAMVLARLQLEKGGPALDTLLKTLPYATGNADYQAFLAGVLQREQRHAEAAQHYRDALAIAPGNAIWWMGMGISLQADQHLPEAREAYTRARGSAGLTPELKSFVDKKIEQLSR